MEAIGIRKIVGDKTEVFFKKIIGRSHFPDYSLVSLSSVLVGNLAMRRSTLISQPDHRHSKGVGLDLHCV